MKLKILYLCCSLIGFMAIPISINGQTCSTDFKVKTSITPSTCQSNGKIHVTLEGAISNLINIEYGLASTTPGGFTINPQNDPILRNIPAGTYDLTVRAFCKDDASYNTVKKVANLVVKGDYKVPVSSLNISASRKSYEGARTGIIVLNVTDGSGDFKFTITSAPAGVTTPTVVTPIKSGTTYTLPTQDYPAGDYTILVEDGCYSSPTSFTLGEMSGLPILKANYSDFRSTFTDYDYHNIAWFPGVINANIQPDFGRYFKDGMYEIGISTGSIEAMPTEWKIWNTQSGTSLTMNMGSYTFKDLYPIAGNTTNLYCYIRLKDNPSIYTSTKAILATPVATTTSPVDFCDYNTSIVGINNTSRSLTCYPVSLVVTESSTGNEIFSKNNISASILHQTIQFDYGKAYKIEYTDANGYVLSQNRLSVTKRTYNYAYIDDYCSDQYEFIFNNFDPCHPFNITITDPAGKVVHTHITDDKNYQMRCFLDYGVKYHLESVSDVTNPAIKYTYDIYREKDNPTIYSFRFYSGDYCNEDQGRFVINTSGSRVPSGSTYRITGPTGYLTQEGVFGTSSSHYPGSAYMPAGLYTLTVVEGCGDTTPIVSYYNHLGVYSTKGFDYTTETTCSGIKLTPKGLMQYQGVEKPNNTFYSIISGPAGYDNTVRTPGGSFQLTTPGKYTLGISYAPSSTACVIKTIDIDYQMKPLSLDANITAAHVCIGGSVGDIFLKAINGVAPYTYELWNKDNTIKLTSDIVTDGIAHFNYGEANEAYSIKVSDVCGNTFNQYVKLLDLKTAHIVYADEEEVCLGSNIELNCITLGSTSYSWTGPNGYTSTEQNPTITNATLDMTGYYTVTVTPESCGSVVEDKVYIQVIPPMIGKDTFQDQTICVREEIKALTNQVTGGTGNFSYQWQFRETSASEWLNIPDEILDTYQPPVHIKSGTYYYRRVTSDKCGKIYGTPIKITVNPCLIPVNPGIRSRIKE